MLSSQISHEDELSFVQLWTRFESPVIAHLELR